VSKDSYHQDVLDGLFFLSLFPMAPSPQRLHLSDWLFMVVSGIVGAIDLDDAASLRELFDGSDLVRCVLPHQPVDGLAPAVQIFVLGVVS